MSPLTQTDLAMFAKIGVGPELLAKAKIARVNDAEAREILCMNGTHGDMSGIWFPVISPKTGYRVGDAIRRDHCEIEDGKPKRKYMNAWGNRQHVFCGPGASELLKDPSVPAVIVEGQKTVLAFEEWSNRTGKKILPLGINGCWGFRGRTGKTESAKGERVDEMGVLPDLVEYSTGRQLYILYDSNAATNPDVRIARRSCAKALRKHKVEVQILNLPIVEGVNGPDDFVGVKGDDALTDLLQHPEPAVCATEEDVATKFSDQYQDELRYVEEWHRWLRFDGTALRNEAAVRVWDDVRRLCKALAEESGDAKLHTTFKRSQFVQHVEWFARTDRRHFLTTEQLDSDPQLLNTSGGTCDLREGRVREHRIMDYLTKSTEVAPRIADCPLWSEFLDRITAGDVELQRYLQRVAGYCLTGITTEHVLFFLYGTGANGKSTFTNTLLGIWGDYGQTAVMETFTENKNDRHPTELAALRGARLVVASESEVGKRWAESRIKALTGGEPIRAHFMRCDDFEFTPQFKLMIHGNHKPGLRAVDEAIRRRVHLVPFTVTIPPEERDPRLSEKLREEWPQILQWAINGCIAWQGEGLNPPAAVRDATEQYFSSEDAILSWLEDRCIVSPQAGRAKAAALYQDFKAWADRTGEFEGTQKRFSQALLDHGFNIFRSNGSWVEGIGLREPEN